MCHLKFVALAEFDRQYWIMGTNFTNEQRNVSKS